MKLDNLDLRDIFFLGDSITYGEWDEGGGWVQRLRAAADRDFFAETGPKTHCYNLGISGHTSAQLLARAAAEMTPRVNPAAKVDVIIAIGMNDAHVIDLEHPCTTPEAFAENLRALIALARRFTTSVALVGLNPVDEARVCPLPWNHNKSYPLARVAAFNKVVAAVAAAEKTGFVDIWSDWNSGEYLPMLCDGLHPDAVGHRRIAVQVGKYLGLTPT